MNPNTKSRVKFARKTQLGLRVVTLLSALCSLFCSIVISRANATVIWVIRAGVSVHLNLVLESLLMNLAHCCNFAYNLRHLSSFPLPSHSASGIASWLWSICLDARFRADCVLHICSSHDPWRMDDGCLSLGNAVQ